MCFRPVGHCPNPVETGGKIAFAYENCASRQEPGKGLKADTGFQREKSI